MSTSAEHNGDDEISAMILSPDPHQPSTKNESHSTPQINCLVLDMQYVKSFTGILKVIEIVLDIVAAICVGMVDVCGTSCLAEEFFQFVCSFTLLLTTALYFIHVFSLLQKIVFIKWPLVDCIFSVIFTLLYIIGSSLMAARAVTVSGKVASAFGFLAFIVYAMSLKHAYTVCKFGCKKQQSQPSPQKV
uniref:CKLF-like MARVEL transmembrane domain-containing protein 4 n=1 Tax=Phallusia mammillata TaxID=59560 RepID=A0A6F9DAD1_9ASCI|nr:CKLF-like MARVEL transmembrane domain-containing protein 4 [Phallusia mammillata]